MTIKTAIFKQLVATAAVTALIGERIFKKTLPQGTELPAINYELISKPTAGHLSGNDSILPKRPYFRFHCWSGVSDTEAETVVAAVIAALQDFQGTMGGGGGVTVQRSFLEEESDGYDPETESFQEMVDFIIWHE